MEQGYAFAEPEVVTSRATISTGQATATKVRTVYEENMKAAGRKKVAKAPFLKQPEEGTKPEETKEGKVQIAMMNTRPFFKMLEMKRRHLH